MTKILPREPIKIGDKVRLLEDIHMIAECEQLFTITGKKEQHRIVFCYIFDFGQNLRNRRNILVARNINDHTHPCVEIIKVEQSNFRTIGKDRHNDII